MQTKTFFSYYWHTDNDNDTNTIIRIYGLDKDNKNVCVIVSNFTPYVYIELPKPYSQWNETTSQILGNKLDEILGEKKPIVKSFMRKYKLYYAYVDIKTKQRIKFPYLFCSFSNANDIKNMFFKLKRNIFIQGVGSIKLKVHESDASPVLQMCCLRNIPTAGWIKFSGNLVDNVDEKITYCDYEYKVRWKNLSPDESNDVPLPLIMGYDIEVNSSVPSAMPDYRRPKDKIFQISCSLSRPNMKEEEYENHLLSLGKPNIEKMGKNVILHTYDTESELLVGFANFIKKYQPNIITGYNIFGFDIPYMIERARYSMCIYEFDQQSCIKNGHATEKSIKWSSSAYKDQFFQYLDAEGRLFVDLLPLIRRDYKFANYKLKTVATNLIGQTKDDLTPQGIFKCYRVGMKGGESGAKALGICGKYCIKDTVLVLNLFEKIQCWIGLTEMAKVCKTSIFSLYTQGQQIKVYSQMYHDCTYKNYVVEKDGYITKEDEYFQGAMVFDPITGLHENVVSFDFNSLYPSTMIAYNLDYSTLIPDDSDIPDEMCGVFEWEEHQGCIHDPNMIKKNNYSIEIKVIDEEIKSLGKERDKKIDKLRKKDIQKQIDNLKLKKKPLIEKRAEYNKKKPKNIMCGKRKFRFLKSEYSVGLMPNILKDLIKARTTTRVEKKDVDEKIKVLKKLENLTKDQTEELSKLETLTIVLDKRQLAYKISANSAYGATGVRRGYLPCMPVAMTTTALGRRNIEKVANIIPEKYGGNLIYGDTDCVLPDTPVLISNNGNIEYMTVEELSDGNWKPTVTGKEMSKPKKGLLVWSDKGFTKIKDVIRHAIVKPLIRVTTHVGSVECSLDHSLLWENGEAAKGSDVKVGDKLCISKLPLPDDTPKFPIYKNKLTEEIIEKYVIPECFLIDNDMSVELAFVWGMFYAEGSCGDYGYKASWAISGQDNKLLTRCANILNKHEKKIQFKILDTMKSSNANKLVPTCVNKRESGVIREFVKRYRELFYDCRRSKRVPSVILNAPFDFRQAFFMGYYAGDGSKKDPAISLSNKGAIGSAGLFYIMKSIGYQVSINTRADKPTIYKLTGSTPEKKMRYPPNVVKKIHPTEIYNKNTPLIKSKEEDVKTEEKPEYIYDIETENHHFAAGVGELVVHNSNYVTFPSITDYSELWEHCKKVSKEVSDMFPKPNALEFEGEIYQKYLILTKKRYMYISSGKDGKILTNKDGTQKIGKKGVLLQRRDNCDFVRELYSNITMEIFNKIPRDDIIYNIIEELNRLCSNQINYKKFITTKAVGNIGEKDDHNNIQNSSIIKDDRGNEKTMIGGYKVPLLSKDPKTRQEQLSKKNASTEDEYYLRCLPAQVQLAEKMRKRGQIVDVGSRIEYIITDPMNVNGKQYEKIEDVEYYVKYSHLVKLDVFHYLKSLVNPIDQILNCIYNKDDNKYKFKYNFMKSQYDFRLNVRQPVIEDIKSLAKPVLVFEKEIKEKKNKSKEIVNEKKNKSKEIVNEKSKEIDNIFIIEEDEEVEEEVKVINEIDIKKEKRRKKKEENKLVMYNDMLRISSKMK